MSYLEKIRALANDPEQLEQAYQDALAQGEGDDFAKAIHDVHEFADDNVLYAAWHYRMLNMAGEAARRVIAWSWALPLAVTNGLLLWLLSDEDRFQISMVNPVTGAELNLLPIVILLAAPITAVFIVVFAAGAGERRWKEALAVGVGLAAAAVYVYLVYPLAGPRAYQEQYVTLMILHLGLLAWAGIGAYVLVKHIDSESRFAFLAKSLEFVVVAGLFAIVGGMFTGVTIGLFDALDVATPEWVMRLFVAGGAGLIAVLSAAIVYDPAVEPLKQSFDDGLGRMVAMLLRFTMVPALIILVIYIGFIPFNFRAPFENREVLVIFSAMLFAVLALIIGVVPVSGRDLEQRLQLWLRRGVIALAALTLVVGVYALAAIVYRTTEDRLTPNRLTFIGWNIINIGVLLLLLVRQWRSGRERWLAGVHSTFATATVAYALWAVLALAALPWLFGIDQGDVTALPKSVQSIVYREPYPVLLTCIETPHIYLLDKGEKRWIEDIPTFEVEGFVWHDVHSIACADLELVPAGQPIPPDAGEPPPVPPKDG